MASRCGSLLPSASADVRSSDDVIAFRRRQPTPQIMLLASNVPNNLRDFTKQFMPNALRILVKKDEATLAGIRQFYRSVEREDEKLGALCELYETLANPQTVIFCNTGAKADRLAEQMHARGMSVSALNSSTSPQERTTIMRDFRTSALCTIITSFILWRGCDIDLPGGLVVGYDTPTAREDYIYRTMPLRSRGVVISLITADDVPVLCDIETYYDTAITEMPANVADILHEM